MSNPERTYSTAILAIDSRILPEMRPLYERGSCEFEIEALMNKNTLNKDMFITHLVGNRPPRSNSFSLSACVMHTNTKAGV